MTRTHVCIIAEAGVNHNGSVQMAKKLIDAGKAAGADVVKFQTAKVEKMTSRFAEQAEYQTKNIGHKESQLEMLKKLHFGDEGHAEVAAYAAAQGVEYMSSPFDMDSVDSLLALKVKTIKIGSGEITNAPMLLKIAQSGLPIILSTGMSTLDDVRDALSVIAFGLLRKHEKPSREAMFRCFESAEAQNSLKEKVTLLHCTTEYPAPLAEVNLKAMATLAETFHVPVGYSDHTQGITVSLAAAALGAVVIEKHFTLDRNLPGPDHKASLEPDELKALVDGVRNIELALGSASKEATASEKKNMKIARKSVVAGREIKKGEKLTAENLECKRPGSGMSPILYWDIVGKTATRDYAADQEIEEPV